MHSFTISINGEDVTAYACYPFSGELTLDRSLDQAYIELKASPRSKPYPPFSEVVVTPNEGEATTFVIASDEVDTIIKTGLSNHRILLCEETKKLERVICPGKTFVQPLVKNYTQIQEPPNDLTKPPFKTVSDLFAEVRLLNTAINGTGIYRETPSDWGSNIPTTLNNLYSPSTTLPSLGTVFNFGYSGNNRLAGYAILLFDAVSGDLIFSNLGNVGVYATTDPTITLPSEYGSYYVYYIANFGAGELYQYATAYGISAVNMDLTQKPPLYITDVTNQLLEIAEPIRANESPRFTLDPEAAARYATTPCNELNFANGATLRENLDEIAGIVHCITRLKNGVVYFDKLGEPDYANTANLGTPVSVRSSANIEKYATHLDSFVDNLMNAQDPKQGAISDPFVRIYRTPRALISNTDARVTVSNCRIDTVFGIEKIEKVEVLYNGGTYDITAFVYEKKEYDLLETNSGVYPYAKAYAIYYTQGQKGLDGLQHRVETAIAPAFQNPAIANILSIVTGRDINWISNNDFFGTAILDYAFNVTYISAVRGRVRAAKKDISEEIVPSAMAFNQAAPRLSSVNFGERLKGETAMLSEPETHLCFKTGNLSAIMDSVGKLYLWDGDRYYISKVNYKVWSGYIIAEMTLSRNFNQLGRFVSINNAFRQFEIDDNSQEECIVYEDYAVFTLSPPENIPSDSLSVGNSLIVALANTLRPRRTGGNALNAGNHEITLCRTRTYDQEGNELSDLILPVQSLALGNSLLFNFSYSDNYSGGEFLQAQSGYKLTRRAPYGDPLYGEARSLGFVLGSDSAYATTADKIAVADRIPLNPGDSIEYSPEASTGDSPLIINKSSRDVPNITYQLHHVTDAPLVFGSALTQTNPLVGYYSKYTTYLVALPFELNPLVPPIPNNYDLAASPVARVGYNVNGTEFASLPAVPLSGDSVAVHSNRLEISLSSTLSELMGYWTRTDSPQSFAVVGNNKMQFILGANASDLLSTQGTPKTITVYLKHQL